MTPPPPSSLPSIPIVVADPTSLAPIVLPPLRWEPPPPRERDPPRERERENRDYQYWDDNRGGGGGGGGGGDRRTSVGYNNSGYGGGGGGQNYGRRRSRSPEWDDRRNKRRRSLSPPYRRDSGGGGYNDNRPPPGRGGGNDFYPPPARGDFPPRSNTSGYRSPSSLPSRSNAPEDRPTRPLPPSSSAAVQSQTQTLLQIPFLLSPRQFFSHATTPQFPSEIEKDAAYKKYRSSYLKKIYWSFFEGVKDKSWCIEKYEVGDGREEKRKARRALGVKGKVGEWVKLLEGGELDDISFDQKLPAAATTTEPKEGEEPTATAEDEDTEMKPATETAVPTPAGSTATTTLAVKELEMIPLSNSDSQLFIKSISPEITREELEAHCAQVPGFLYLALGEPNPTKNFHRVGWVTFENSSYMAKATEVLCESTISNFTLHMTLNTTPISGRVKFSPPGMGAAERIKKDLPNVKKLVGKFEKEVGDDSGSREIENKFISWGGDDGGEKVEKKVLDLYLHYLRFSFNTCYYCLVVADFPEELERKCPKHLRREGPAIAVKPGNDQHPAVAKFDDKLPLLVDRENVDPADFGGDSPEEEIHRVCLPHVKQEEEGKYRCKECNKLFSALKFIEKHISVKHPALIGDALEKLKYYNNFILDPGHAPNGALEPLLISVPGSTNNPSTNNNPSNGNNVQGGAGGYHHPHPHYNNGGRGALSDRIGGRIPDESLGGGGGPGFVGQQMPFRGQQQMGMGFGMGMGPGMGPGMGGPGYNNMPYKKQFPPTNRGPLPPPAGAVLDPRARKGASSYADLDGAPAGVADVVLQY